MFALAAIWMGSSAFALQEVQSGPTIELGIGPALGGRPARAALAGQVSVGWWRGPYDDEYALGRFWAGVVTTRIDWAFPDQPDLRITPMFELRRGMDLFVVAPHFFAAAGPVFGFEDVNRVGVAVRVGGGLKLRRSKHLGFIGRLAGGVDIVAGNISPSLTVTLGGGWSSPVGTRSSAR
jgi:hypothetical protein